MKIVTNTAIIESRSKWAKRIAPLTMIFLVGGLITNFMSVNRPELFRLTLLLLALGFIFATISSYLVNRWVREPRADQVLEAILKKFGKEFILFNYTSTPPHILMTPTRLYVIVVKQQDGQVTVKGSRFSRKFTWRRLLRFFADEGMGAPVAEAESYVDKLHKFLTKTLPEGEDLPELAPLVIFSNKEVELIVNDPVIPVMRSNELKSYLRDNDKIRNISAAQRHALTEIIGGEWSRQA
jgi:hypothetical protein